MANNQMTSEMRQLEKAGRKQGWKWELVRSEHFRVFAPCGTLVATIAPRNRHWRKHFVGDTRGWDYPGLRR